MLKIVRHPLLAAFAILLAGAPPAKSPAAERDGKLRAPAKLEVVAFDRVSARDGRWSEPETWKPEGVPAAGERVMVSPQTRVVYDVESEAAIRLVQVAGVLSFARDRNTALNVGILKVQNSTDCSESGFACDFHSVNDVGEPHEPPAGPLPALEVGTLDAPIPAEFTARIRLHFLEGMDANDAPALSCCSARLDLHGAPMSRTWVDLGADAQPGDRTVTLSQDVTGWKTGDEVIVTGAKRKSRGRTFRGRPDSVTTEERRIVRIEGTTVELDKPLEHEHYGTGEFRSEIANLSRNVIIESADPEGVRGHTIYHRFSKGSIGYGRFAHLGKEGVLGRYAIHFHLLGDTNRGGSVVGAAIVDSHNRWITIHGTNYLVVRDCVGYQSVGHGFFLEDGTECYNVLDRNLGVQAYHGKRLPGQVLPFDPNDAAAFWWANGRNALVRNVSCENDEYGYRYDMQHSRYFDSRLMIASTDGRQQLVDVRTVPLWRFEDNEAHTEGFYGVVIAANGNQQPDTSIRDEGTLERIRGIDWTGPDTNHPHVIRNLAIWESHYAMRPHSPSMLMENVRIDRAAYGIYRPAFENHVYRNLHISRVAAEPFNRGMDDASAQVGRITVDGLTFEDFSPYGLALVQMTDNDLSGEAACHFRNLELVDVHPRRAVFDRGGGAKADPITETGVPYFIHDHFGSGRHAKIVSTKAADLLAAGGEFGESRPLTGEESRIAEVTGVEFPQLLDPIDDLPPATVVTSLSPAVPVKAADGVLIVRGTTTENFRTKKAVVNGVEAANLDYNYHLWEARLTDVKPGRLEIVAHSEDEAGNIEQVPHRFTVTVE
ncbi:MAG: G8 domain-containing protein [Planctomycetes bacterium]|nr:G8 domain-containing protein [Planctomycetota bacterium]